MRGRVSPGKYVALLVLILCVASVGLGLARRTKVLAPATRAAAARPTPPLPRESGSAPDVPCHEPPPPLPPKRYSDLPKGTIGATPDFSGRTPHKVIFEPSNYLSLSNVKLVRVEDAAGRAEYPFNERRTGQHLESVTYDYNGKGSLMISTSVDKTYAITFQPGDGASTLDLLRGLNNEVPDLAVRYNDLLLPAGSTALIKVTPRGIEPLRLDKDGDGTFESVVPPDASVSGEAANDTRGPTLCFGQSERDGATFVTIAAADSSGVRAIYYSLDASSQDEMSFRLYAGPFQVNPQNTPLVTAFADDKIGNRGGRTEFRLAAKH
jgi:hypothetical protein